MFTDTSHRVEITLFIIFAFIAFCTPDFWQHWTFLAAMALVALIFGNYIK